MFICERCGKNSNLGEKMVRLVTKTRVVRHPAGDATVEGTQIVQEMSVHESCTSAGAKAGR